VDLDDELTAKALGLLVHGITENDLSDTVPIAKVNEADTLLVTAFLYPSGEGHSLADMRRAELTT